MTALAPHEIENRRACYHAVAEGLRTLGHFDAADQLMDECWQLYGQSQDEVRTIIREASVLLPKGPDAWQ